MSYVTSNLVLLNGHQPERFFFYPSLGSLYDIPDSRFYKRDSMNHGIHCYYYVYGPLSTPMTSLRWCLNKYGDFVIYIIFHWMTFFEILEIFYLKLYFPHLRKKCIKIQSYLSHATEKRCVGRKEKDRVFLCWIFNIVEIL